jgi:hypothetical protein
MNTTTMNKDNAGSTVLLAAMILTIAAALFGSVNANAKPVTAIAPKASTTGQATSTKTTTDAFVITATRLK